MPAITGVNVGFKVISVRLFRVDGVTELDPFSIAERVAPDGADLKMVEMFAISRKELAK